MSALKQISTFGIFKRMIPRRLQHLATEAGLESAKYNTHEKRAAGMTAIIYKGGLHERAQKRLDEAFK